MSDACEVELVKVLELLPGGDTMLLRAGVNWAPGVVGHATLPAHARSPGGYALDAGEPVVSRDVAQENRFEIPRLLVDHGVQSMVNVLIAGEHGPWGVLEIDSRERRDFDEDDVAFLQTYANLLAAAVERHRTHQALFDAVEQGRMLHAELQHRGRNLLANVQALALRTRRSSADLDTFLEAFTARPGALARTQALLTPGASKAVSLRAVLVQELEAHGIEPGDRISLGGSDVDVPANAAQALAMGFYELATNASKHGPFSRKSARLDVRWWVEPGSAGSALCIQWRETGVPIPTPPDRRGTGSETIERSLPRLLGGTATLTFHPDGVECGIRCNLMKSTVDRLWGTGGRELRLRELPPSISVCVTRVAGADCDRDPFRR